MTMVFSKPGRLVAEFQMESSIWYAAIPFLIVSIANSCGALLAYRSGYTQPINPMPKLLPIPDTYYLLFQASIGPFVKLTGIFIFAGILVLMNRLLKLPGINIKQIVLFSVLVGNTFGLVAVAVDQIIIYSQIQGNLRFLLSTIHPIVFILDIAYVAMFVVCQTSASLVKALALVMPGMIMSGPVLGILFR